jgi:serine/threonine protein kinase
LITFGFSCLQADAFSIAILYLETQKKVHRDISYTNILLRETDNSDTGREAREKVMEQLGLSEIEEIRKRLNCREGLLIDFDYASALAGEQTFLDEEETNSGETQREGSQSSDSSHFKPSGARTVS